MMTVSRKTMETVVTAVRDITVGEEINVSCAYSHSRVTVWY